MNLIFKKSKNEAKMKMGNVIGIPQKEQRYIVVHKYEFKLQKKERDEIMIHNELKKLIKYVNNNVYCGVSTYTKFEDDNHTPEHDGEIPMYITSALISDKADDGIEYVFFVGIQPSGKKVTFIMPYSHDDYEGKEKLPSGRIFSLTIGRYAIVDIRENSFEIIPDETIIDIVSSMKGGVA